MRRWLAALVATAAAVAVTLPLPAGAQTAAPVPPSHPQPPIGHVFVINLENESFTTSFGPTSPATYLNSVLRPQGVLLTQYYGIGHESLDNYVAEISGQGPNADTQGDCQLYTDFVGVAGPPPAQAVGQGCVYPASVPTLADELDARGLTWKGYMEDMGNVPSREGATCGHPALNSRDGTQSAQVGDQYAARHDPFVYFHSIIDSPVCNQRVVPLTQLSGDLASGDTTPNVSFITPNLCNDGHDAPCVDGRPGGLTSADQWLSTWVPKILASAAFRSDGLLVVTFDEAATSDASSCCGEGPSPNTPFPGISGTGGGVVGAVAVSRFISPNTWNDTPYNHYSLLCSIENLFRLPKLGNAANTSLPCFGTDVYNGPGWSPTWWTPAER
jgi:hypothetical protein